MPYRKGLPFGADFTSQQSSVCTALMACTSDSDAYCQSCSKQTSKWLTSCPEINPMARGIPTGYPTVQFENSLIKKTHVTFYVKLYLR